MGKPKGKKIKRSAYVCFSSFYILFRIYTNPITSKERFAVTSVPNVESEGILQTSLESPLQVAQKGEEERGHWVLYLNPDPATYVPIPLWKSGDLPKAQFFSAAKRDSNRSGWEASTKILAIQRGSPRMAEPTSGLMVRSLHRCTVQPLFCLVLCLLLFLGIAKWAFLIK